MTSTTWNALRDSLRGVAPDKVWYRLAHFAYERSRLGFPLYTYQRWNDEGGSVREMDWTLPFADFKRRLLLAWLRSAQRRHHGT